MSEVPHTVAVTAAQQRRAGCLGWGGEYAAHTLTPREPTVMPFATTAHPSEAAQ